MPPVKVLMIAGLTFMPLLAACGHNPYAYSEGKRRHYQNLYQDDYYRHDRRYNTRHADCRKHRHDHHYDRKATAYADCPCRVVSRY